MYRSRIVKGTQLVSEGLLRVLRRHLFDFALDSILQFRFGNLQIVAQLQVPNYWNYWGQVRNTFLEVNLSIPPQPYTSSPANS